MARVWDQYSTWFGVVWFFNLAEHRKPCGDGQRGVLLSIAALIHMDSTAYCSLKVAIPPIVKCMRYHVCYVDQ